MSALAGAVPAASLAVAAAVACARARAARADADATARTARRERDAETARAGALAVFAELALSGAPEDDLLQTAVDLVAEHVGADCTSALELCPRDARLAVRAAFGWPDGVAGGLVLPPGLAAHAWWALEAPGSVVLVEDVRAEERFAAADLLARGSGLLSGIAAAVRVEGRTFGVLTAHARSAHAFGPAEARFVAAVARLVAVAARRSRALAA